MPVCAVAGQRDSAPSQLWSAHVDRDDLDRNGGRVLQRLGVEHRLTVVVAKRMDSMKSDSPRQEEPQHDTNNRGTGETHEEIIHGLESIGTRNPADHQAF